MMSAFALRAFYEETAIGDWTCVHMVEYYRSNSEQKDRKKILDRIKKDLEEVEVSDSFDIIKKRKAREILDDWKNWTAQQNPKRSGIKIEKLQVKKIKQFATGNHATQFNNSHITFGQETTNTEGASSQEGEPTARLRGKKNICYTESQVETDSSGSEKPRKIKKTNKVKIKGSSSLAGSSSSSH